MAVGETIRCRGRTEVVRGEHRLGHKTVQILEQLGTSLRPRYRVYDRAAGPRGDWRLLLVLPRTAVVSQHVAVLERLQDARNVNVPLLVEFHRQRDSMDLLLAWTPGCALAEHLTRMREGREAAASAWKASRLIRGLAHGLCQLHHRWNVNHGDIKPANLILAPQGRSLSTIDFGSAWLAERGAHRDAGDGVSGAYAAPELLAGDTAADFRSDQFSVSVVWYELLTGRIPYDGVGGKAGTPSLRAAFAGKLIPPSELVTLDSVPRAIRRCIDSTVCQGLALDPSERHPNPRTWLDALDDIHHASRQQPRLTKLNRFVADWLGRWMVRR